MPSKSINLSLSGQGLHEVTQLVNRASAEAIAEAGPEAKLECALCTVFLPHTSASLLIQENADSSAKRDLEVWLNRLVPEGDALYTHTLEGPDDMPAHIKAALTATSVGIPIIHGRLALGTWQGIYVWEHRHGSQQRQLIVHIG